MKILMMISADSMMYDVFCTLQIKQSIFCMTKLWYATNSLKQGQA